MLLTWAYFKLHTSHRPLLINILRLVFSGSTVLTAAAIDRDPGTTLTYSLTGATFDTFAVDHTTGKIFTVKTLDYEVRQHGSPSIQVHPCFAAAPINLLISSSEIGVRTNMYNKNSPLEYTRTWESFGCEVQIVMFSSTAKKNFG